MGGWSNHNYHARSNSLPTRPHPLVSECDEHLCRLKALESSACGWSAAAMGQRLAGLQDLQECVSKVVVLRRTREAFAAHRREKWVDEVFDGSLRLLDMCSAAKDAVIHTKECVRELRAMLRRRSWGSANALSNEVEKYIASRKVVKRAIQKALSSTKGSGGAKPSSSSISIIKDPETMALIALLFDVEAAGLAVFEALLSYASGKKARPKPTGWALVSKLMRARKPHPPPPFTDHDAPDHLSGDANEFAAVDAAVDAAATRLADGGVEGMGEQLGKLEACVQDLEGGLEGLFRRLIRNRVSLLNILNN